MSPFKLQLSKFQCLLLDEFSWNRILNDVDEMHRESCVCLIRKT